MLFDLYRKSHPRLNLFYVVFGLLFLALGAGLAYRQVLQGALFRDREEKQNHRKILRPGPRGYIFDREGRLLVGNQPRFSAVVYLNELRAEFRTHYRDLRDAFYPEGRKFDSPKLERRARREVVQRYLLRAHRVIGQETAGLLTPEAEAALSKRVERHFARELMLPLTLVKDLDEVDYARLINQLPVDSPIQPFTDSSRYYPQGSAAAHTLGYVVEGDQLRFSAVVRPEVLLPEVRVTFLELRERRGDGPGRDAGPADVPTLLAAARKAVVHRYLEQLAELLNAGAEPGSPPRRFVLDRAELDRYFSSGAELPLPLAKDLTDREQRHLTQHRPPGLAIETHPNSRAFTPPRRPLPPPVARAVGAPRPAAAAGDYAAVAYPSTLREALDRHLETHPHASRAAALGAALQDHIDETGRALGRVLEIDPVRLAIHAGGRSDLPITLLDRLTEAEKTVLAERLPPGSPVEIHHRANRYRPTPRLLGPAVSTDPGDGAPDLITFSFKGSSGRTGIERSFDHHLQGADGEETWVVDPSGVQYQRTALTEPVKGEDLYLSLDLDLQRAAERALEGQIEAAVALDIQTGEVLVLANKPDFDLNRFSPYIPSEVYNELILARALRNRALQGLYPPASTFKIITAIAGLRSGAIGTDTAVVCRGSYFLARGEYKKCHNHNGHSQPPDFLPLGLEEALMLSCNPFFYHSGIRAGIGALSTEARRFGFDRPTGIRLPHEARNMIVPDTALKRKKWPHHGPWTDGDTANLAIGQGYLRVTPLQVAAFVASFARRETHTRVSILRGAPVNHGAAPLGLNDADYGRIVEGMERAVSGRRRLPGGGEALAGSAHYALLPGIRTAAKTGTAEFFSDGQKLSLAWFIAFAPIEDPALAIAVVVEGKRVDPADPDNVIPVPVSGGKTSAPIGRVILETFFQKSGRLADAGR